jgi:predicted dehydrogenase
MSEKTRWGILATGNIAHKFADGLQALDDAELVAVGSRSQASADEFGEEYDVPRRHPTYEALAADDEVDAIYVSTPHPFHKENTLLCLEHGKAVLCEKPFAVNADEAEVMLNAAREKGLFLMEAMWTHFFPAMERIRELVAEGAIGEVRMVKADFCFRSGWNPEGRLLNPELAGGGLLDVGVYCIALAQMVYGKAPAQVTGIPHLGETGVDEQAGMVLGYDDGALAVLTCAVRTSTPHEALIVGTDGWIKVPPLFWQPDKIIVASGGEEKEETFERLGNGYSYEAREVGACLREGRLESEVVPHAKTLDIMRTMDKLREQWGLRYPIE